MADLGYRSVEVVVTNDTRGNLTVQAVGIGSGATWVQGETPTQGQQLNQYNSTKWGVSTTDVNGAASGQCQLTGLGNYPVTIVFTNNPNGSTSCSVTGNDQVTYVQPIVQQNTGEANHSQFMVQLIPAS